MEAEFCKGRHYGLGRLQRPVDVGAIIRSGSRDRNVLFCVIIYIVETDTVGTVDYSGSESLQVI